MYPNIFIVETEIVKHDKYAQLAHKKNLKDADCTFLQRL